MKNDIESYFDLGIKQEELDIAIYETDYEKNHGRIDIYREGNGVSSTTKNYYILSRKFSLDRFIQTTKEHWSIECSLHWRLDVILDEDHSIDNLAIIRKIVFNLARFDNTMVNLTLKKKLTRYLLDFHNIENLIFHIIPSL